MRNLFLLFSLILITGCSNGSYKEASSSAPHAVVNFQPKKGPLGSPILGGVTTVFPLEINGLPPNQWNKWNFQSFKVNPGPVSMLLEAPISSRLTATTYIKFNALKDENYQISTLVQERSIKILVKNKSGKIVTSSTASKSPVRHTPSYVPLYIPVPG